MRNLRVHLRHTGDPKFRFGVSRGYFSKYHYNLYFGRLFLAIREKRPNEVPRKLIDLDMGRAQLKFQRLWDTMNDDEKNLYWAQHPPVYLKPFLELLRSDPVAAHKRFGPYPIYEGEQNDHA